VPDAILSNESLELFTAECRAIISDYLLRNSMGRENSSLDGPLCCYLLHYFKIHPWVSTITKCMCPMQSQDVNIPMVELAISMDEEVL